MPITFEFGSPFDLVPKLFRKKQYFGEGLIYIMNKQSCPYDNGALLKQALRCLADLMMGSSSSSFFPTNDLNLVVDILVREIENLDSNDRMREDYLVALSLLLQNSGWKSKGGYRKKNIRTILHAILDVDLEYDEAVLVTAQKVWDDCHGLLDVIQRLESSKTLHI